MAILCYKDVGPYFGDIELSALYEPFNKENACLSFPNGTVYSIPENIEGINMLTNMKCANVELTEGKCYFTITEFEVWGVSFKE
jgi:hypothetical protein